MLWIFHKFFSFAQAKIFSLCVGSKRGRLGKSHWKHERLKTNHRQLPDHKIYFHGRRNLP